jgi:hypothetical protein
MRLADELLFVVDFSGSAPYGHRVFSAVDGNRHIIVLQDVADVTESPAGLRIDSAISVSEEYGHNVGSISSVYGGKAG